MAENRWGFKRDTEFWVPLADALAPELLAWAREYARAHGISLQQTLSATGRVTSALTLEMRTEAWRRAKAQTVEVPEVQEAPKATKATKKVAKGAVTLEDVMAAIQAQNVRISALEKVE